VTDKRIIFAHILCCARHEVSTIQIQTIEDVSTLESIFTTQTNTSKVGFNCSCPAGRRGDDNIVMLGCDHDYVVKTAI